MDIMKAACDMQTMLSSTKGSGGIGRGEGKGVGEGEGRGTV